MCSQGCDRHQFNTRHNEAKYYEYFTRVKEELESEFPEIAVSAKSGKPRVGAFEVRSWTTVRPSRHQSRGSGWPLRGQVVSESGVIYFSKLETRQFPAAGIFKKLVAEKGTLRAHPSC